MQAKLYAYNDAFCTAAELAAFAGCSIPVMKGRLITMDPCKAVALGAVRKPTLYPYGDSLLTVAELASVAGVSESCMRNRLVRNGGDAAAAVQQSAGQRGPAKFWWWNDAWCSIADLAKEAGCSYETMKSRMGKQGKTPAEAVAMGPSSRSAGIVWNGNHTTVRAVAEETGMSESWVSKYARVERGANVRGGG